MLSGYPGIYRGLHYAGYPGVYRGLHYAGYPGILNFKLPMAKLYYRQVHDVNTHAT